MAGVLIIGAALMLAASCTLRNEPSGEMPETLAGLERVRLVTGREALDRVADLHGKPPDIEDCAIGVYGEGEKSATVWISRATTPSGSEEQAMLMIERMKDGSGPFHGPEVFRSDGVRIYRFEGMGQLHYVFTKDDLAFWISAPPELGTQAVQEFF
jgi:hypothetical protein